MDRKAESEVAKFYEAGGQGERIYKLRSSELGLQGAGSWGSRFSSGTLTLSYICHLTCQFGIG